jgi:hypothetical protein
MYAYQWVEAPQFTHPGPQLPEPIQPDIPAMFPPHAIQLPG